MIKPFDNKTQLKMAMKYNRFDLFNELCPKSSISRDQKNSENVHYNKNRSDDNNGTGSNTIPDNILLRFYWSCRWSDGYEWITEDKISDILGDQPLKPNCYTEDGFTPLMIAVKYRRVKYIKLLLESPRCKIEVFEKCSLCFKRTVLHICAEIGNDEITELLLDKAQCIGVNVTPIDVMGNTPLHICAKAGNIHMCERLLSLRENYPQLIFDSRTEKTQLEMRNNDGLTPFHQAIENHYDEIVKIMLKYGGDSEKLKQQLTMPTVKNLRTSLHLAALKGKQKSLKQFPKSNMNETTKSFHVLIIPEHIETLFLL